MTNGKKLFEKILAARANFRAIVKNRVNPHFKSKYADLDALLHAVESPLADEGVIITSSIRRAEEGWVLCTAVVSEGERIESTFPLPADTSNPQKMGSAIKYGRRYNLASLLNLRDEDDDDGNAAGPGAANGGSSRGRTGEKAGRGRDEEAAAGPPPPSERRNSAGLTETERRAALSAPPDPARQARAERWGEITTALHGAFGNSHIKESEDKAAVIRATFLTDDLQAIVDMSPEEFKARADTFEDHLEERIAR